MHLLPTDPFQPPPTTSPPEVVVLDDQQIGHLMTRAFEMVAVALAVQYGRVDGDAAINVGLVDTVIDEIVTRAIIFGTRLIEDVDADDLCLTDQWTEDWQAALSAPGYTVVPHG
jgi:hypothetical protein